MSIKSLYLLIAMLFFCFDVLSQNPEKPIFNSSELYVVEENGKELVSELNYQGAILVFKTAKKRTYLASANDLKYFDNLIENTKKLETCMNNAQTLEKGKDIPQIVNKYLECSEIFPTVRIKSIESKFINYALAAKATVDTNTIIKALKYIVEGDELLEKKGRYKNKNKIDALNKYGQAKILPDVPNFIKELAQRKIDKVTNKKKEKDINPQEPKGVESINSRKRNESKEPSKNWNVNIYLGAFIGKPVIANNKESLTTRIPAFNSEIGIEYASKIKKVKAVDLFWGMGLGYMPYSFATTDGNQKDIESFKLDFLKVQGAVKVFTSKEGLFRPFIKLEPFALIPVKTEYHNYFNEGIDPAVSIARTATLGGTVSVGVEINYKSFRAGIEPFIMKSGSFLKSNPGIEGLQNPTQLKSSLLGYGVKLYIGFGNSQSSEK